MPEINVNIKWNKPDDKNWLCPFNIEFALSQVCKNTKFEVKEIREVINETENNNITYAGSKQ